MRPLSAILSTSLQPRGRRRGLACVLVLFCSVVGPLAISAHAERITLQEIDDETFADRPIAEVRIEGLDRVEESLVRHNLRTAAGQPFEAQSLRNDVTNLYRLGKFQTVNADAELLPDGSIRVTYTLAEQALIRDVQTVGNSLVSDQELLAAIPLYQGGPRDDFLVEQSLIRIKDLYHEKGYYLAEVTIDETRLQDAGLLIFTVVEGPRVRIREITFTGNDHFPDNELASKIRTKPAIPLFRKGELDTDLLIDDTATIDRYYRDRGFIDVRVDHRVLLSPNSKNAKVVFLIDEGRQYRLQAIAIQSVGTSPDSPLGVFSDEQLLALARIRPGEVVSSKGINDTRDAIREAYLQMGYLDVRVTTRNIRASENAEMDLFIQIYEGERFQAGLVLIQGNFITKDKVIRRLVRILPGRPLNGAVLEEAKERLNQTQLFSDVSITIQQPSDEEPEVRDVIVVIKERNTGSFNFGVGLGSDAGISGEFSFNQSNFDIADFPLSVEELLAVRAFRGAGQKFRITIAPGNKMQIYAIDLTEPHLFESDISGRGSFVYTRTRHQQQQQFYDEDRLNGSITIGRRLGDVWVGNVSTSLQRVYLDDFGSSTPVEVANDAGPDVFATLSASLKRTTLDNMMRPTAGSILDVGVSKYFGIDGDVDFWKASAGVTTFLTMQEDLLGNKQVLKLKAACSYIFSGSAPTYEQFYLGGRSLRGFRYQTVSPKSALTLGGIGTPQPVGGIWMFSAGAQYEIPVFKDSAAVVAFIDSGTVLDSPGFAEYRVSIGVGLRLYIPMLGPAPLAFDFGFPIIKEADDRTQLFSFNAELPF